MTTMIRASILIALIIGLACAQDFPICFTPTDNSTSTNAMFNEYFMFPVFINDSTAQRKVVDNTTQWQFTFGYLDASASGANCKSTITLSLVLKRNYSNEKHVLSSSLREYRKRNGYSIGSLRICRFQDPSFRGVWPTHY